MERNDERDFAKDMMRYVAVKYNIDWVPRERRNISTFTRLNADAIDAYLEEHDRAIILNFYSYAPRPSYRSFADFVISFVTPGRGDPVKHPFVWCAEVARYATLFYNNGKRNAPDVAIDLLEGYLIEAARLYDDNVFRILGMYCLDLKTSSNQRSNQNTK